MGNLNISKPFILYEGEYDLSTIESLKKNKPIWRVTDLLKSQLQELFEVENPHLIGKQKYQEEFSTFISAKLSKNSALMGNWVYYPWNGNFIHMIGESDYFKLRTNRNKLIISPEEQTVIGKYKVGILGLSVGSSMAINIAYTNISQSIRLADPDNISTTNLNRLTAATSDIGINKTIYTMQKIYEVNPYAEIKAYPDGINSKSADDFLSKPDKLNAIIEEVDDFRLKFTIRTLAKKLQIPVIMLTNLGDNMLIDIERYDIDPNLEIFNGKCKGLSQLQIPESITTNEIKKYSIDIVGEGNIPERVINTIKRIGVNYVGRPQVMSSVFISAGVVAYIIRQLALGGFIPSGRHMIKFSNFLK